MDKKQIFFWAPENRPFTHNEYIYVANYKYNYPEEDVNLCLFSPTDGNVYSHLAAFSGVSLLWVGAPNVAEQIKTEIHAEQITPENILSLPFFDISEYISRKVTDSTTILDLGCGNKALSNKILKGSVTTVDAFRKFHPDILWDLTTTPLPFGNNSFDIVLLMDVIEHLPKDSGIRLLREAKRIVRERLFVLTPLQWKENKEETFDPNSEYYENEFNFHRSLWQPNEFEDFTRVNNRLVDGYFFGYYEKN